MLPRSGGLGSLLGLALLAGCQPVEPVDLARVRLVDLTHPLNSSTIFWPTSPTRFSLDTVSFGQTPGGWFYSAFAFATPEHGGTHLDAPAHFGAGQPRTDEIPLARLVAPGIVIDVRDSAAANPDYLLSRADIDRFETDHGPIPEGAIVLLLTGWSARWPDANSYLGDDTAGDASNLHFPSYGPEAASFLISERRVGALGADVASIDYGPSSDFPVHRLAAEAGVPGLENLTALENLPATGSTIVALPVKIEGGSGGPLRAIALVPNS